MQEGGAVTVSRKAPARSSIFNDPRRLARKVDSRSLDGRLYIDLYDALRRDYPDADPVKVRDVAVLKLASEKAVALGAWEDVVRLQNLAGRKEASLKAAQRVATVAAGRSPDGMRGTLRARYAKGGTP
jgi:hypothetical protein